jgi:hypothetical protein
VIPSASPAGDLRELGFAELAGLRRRELDLEQCTVGGGYLDRRDGRLIDDDPKPVAGRSRLPRRSCQSCAGIYRPAARPNSPNTGGAPSISAKRKPGATQTCNASARQTNPALAVGPAETRLRPRRHAPRPSRTRRPRCRPGLPDRHPRPRGNPSWPEPSHASPAGSRASSSATSQKPDSDQPDSTCPRPVPTAYSDWLYVRRAAHRNWPLQEGAMAAGYGAYRFRVLRISCASGRSAAAMNFCRLSMVFRISASEPRP